MTTDVTRRALMLGSVGTATALGLGACGATQASDEDRPLRIKAADTTMYQRNFNP